MPLCRSASLTTIDAVQDCLKGVPLSWVLGVHEIDHTLTKFLRSERARQMTRLKKVTIVSLCKLRKEVARQQ